MVIHRDCNIAGLICVTCVCVDDCCWHYSIAAAMIVHTFHIFSIFIFAYLYCLLYNPTFTIVQPPRAPLLDLPNNYLL